MQANHSFTRRQAVLTGMSGTKLWTTGKGTLSGSKDHHDYFSLGSLSKSPTLRIEPPFVFLNRKIKRGSGWVLNRKSCPLSSNWSSECELPFIDKTMVITKPDKPDARPRFKTLSQQKAAHVQQRSSGIHGESFSSTPKSIRGKVEEVPRNCVAYETMQKK